MTGRAYLEVDEVERLERAATNARDRLLICLLFRTGCRVSEVVGLGVEDLDLRAGMVRVVRLKQRLQVYCPGCGTRPGRSRSFCPGVRGEGRGGDEKGGGDEAAAHPAAGVGDCGDARGVHQPRWPRQEGRQAPPVWHRAGSGVGGGP